MRNRTVPVVALVALMATACAWPTFRHGPDRTGFSPDMSISKDAVASGSMVIDWSAPASESSPSVTDGKVYTVGAFASAPERLQVFDAAGNAGCSGNPKTCSPLWTSTSLGPGLKPVSTPAVANGVVYVGGIDHTLFAFDARGNTNCSGVPKVCSPLWTSTSTAFAKASPVVSRGKVYISAGTGANALYAFDAEGKTNCSGSPKTCTPLWTGPPGQYGSVDASSPAVVGRTVYVGLNNDTNSHSINGALAAYDADGANNCSGTPTTCVPLWIGPMPFDAFGTPAVSNGVVYLANNGLSLLPSSLYAFDAAGGPVHCSGGAPTKTCIPLWTAPLQDGAVSSPAVAYGTVWIADSSRLKGFDAAGNTNCSGAPKTCTPVRIAQPPTTAGVIGFSSPAIANGVIYIGEENDSCCPGSLDGTGLYAYDATGDLNCTGAPKTCAPLWSLPNQQVFSSPVVASGRVYFNGDALKAYKPTPPRRAGSPAAVGRSRDVTITARN